MGTLYLVGTPIGNLEDISKRALRILQEVPLIAAEDTRVTGRLLARFEIDTPLTSYHEHNRRKKLPTLISHLEKNDLALVSDAGMPGLSDPGYDLVRAAVEAGFPIVPIPGPSAVVSALVVSGLPTDQFLFLGFLPRKTAARRETLEELVNERRTVVVFEAPHRLVETLKIIQVLGSRPLAVARELTKMHEEVRRGTAADLLDHFMGNPPKGEITLVIGGGKEKKPASWDDQKVLEAIQNRIAAGDSPTEAAKAIAAASGRSRRGIYRLAFGDE